jgi:hypothetical protein
MDLEGEKDMVIRYKNGQKIEGVLLSRTAKVMRVALQGSEDVLVLNEVNGSWITDDCEPVEVSFAWELPPAPVVREEDFICSPELAAQLIDMLQNCEESESNSKALGLTIPARII